jgi:hypothetical protein
MHPELLVVPDCPNGATAAHLFRQALDAAGFSDREFETITVDTEEDARARRFFGSPAFMVNGQDLFGTPEMAPGVSCRMYLTASGRITGTPDLEELITRVQRAAEISDAS